MFSMNNFLLLKIIKKSHKMKSIKIQFIKQSIEISVGVSPNSQSILIGFGFVS